MRHRSKRQWMRQCILMPIIRLDSTAFDLPNSERWEGFQQCMHRGRQCQRARQKADWNVESGTKEKGETDTLSARFLLLITGRVRCVRKRFRELVPKIRRQRQWKCERSSAARNVGTRREKEEINMIKKFACMHRNDHQYKISRLISNDEGRWRKRWRC